MTNTCVTARLWHCGRPVRRLLVRRVASRSLWHLRRLGWPLRRPRQRLALRGGWPHRREAGAGVSREVGRHLHAWRCPRVHGQARQGRLRGWAVGGRLLRHCELPGEGGSTCNASRLVHCTPAHRGLPGDCYWLHIWELGASDMKGQLGVICHRLTWMRLRRRQVQGLADTEHCCKRPQAAEVYALRQLQWAGSLDPRVGQRSWQRSGFWNFLQRRDAGVRAIHKQQCVPVIFMRAAAHTLTVHVCTKDCSPAEQTSGWGLARNCLPARSVWVPTAAQAWPLLPWPPLPSPPLMPEWAGVGGSVHRVYQLPPVRATSPI